MKTGSATFLNVKGKDALIKIIYSHLASKQKNWEFICLISEFLYSIRKIFRTDWLKSLRERLHLS